jgi:hypothetical protein
MILDDDENNSVHCSLIEFSTVFAEVGVGLTA